MPSFFMRVRGQAARAVISGSLGHGYTSTTDAGYHNQKDEFLLQALPTLDRVQSPESRVQRIAVVRFDALEEALGEDEVWCLLVLPHKALMLKQHANGTYGRLGRLLSEDVGWFDEHESTELCLC
jgi:hypothetical protein